MYTTWPTENFIVGYTCTSQKLSLLLSVGTARWAVSVFVVGAGAYGLTNGGCLYHGNMMVIGQILRRKHEAGCDRQEDLRSNDT